MWKWWKNRKTTGSTWKQPELEEGDQLVETYIVHKDGSRDSIVLIYKAVKFPDGAVRAHFEGYSRSLDLPPGSSVFIPEPWEFRP